MQILGFLKTTLLDYPGHVASTVFTGGCNFRCPFCHNGDLVLHANGAPTYSEEEVFAHLTKRKGVLDGVCITGGEPTLQPDLADFIRKIRSLGYAVKLDTNGYRPDILQALCNEGLIDYVAMDIKQAPSHYNDVACCTDFSIHNIEESVSFLMQGNIPYEFRTTLVRELHTEEDIAEIGQFLSGARAYFLQAYKDSEQVIRPGFHAHTTDELLHFQEILKRTISNVTLRGID